MIYAIEAVGLDRVKFGKAKDPEARFRILSTASPVPLQLIIVAPWPDFYEGVIHRAFAEERITGEWFLATKRVEKFCHIMDGGGATESERFANSMAYIERICPAPAAGPITRPAERIQGQVPEKVETLKSAPKSDAERARAYRQRHAERVRAADRERKRKARAKQN